LLCPDHHHHHKDWRSSKQKMQRKNNSKGAFCQKGMFVICKSNSFARWKLCVEVKFFFCAFVQQQKATSEAKLTQKYGNSGGVLQTWPKPSQMAHASLSLSKTVCRCPCFKTIFIESSKYMQFSKGAELC
jgi:hypothetical protein